eukprot:TRINITY_DN4799_c0_g1_i1.p1 TRINITY_DN4799_c0_g1~~TRINITY_DN4799_c0_g1_i1.p1  ORF type:complete len:691 (+),score=-42.76 TRINITY_DN4799_c0_g1_i1:76-2148(+)
MFRSLPRPSGKTGSATFFGQKLRTPAPMEYRREIDGLRAMAVSAVLANHFFELYAPNGYLGVDIFFVISGFVITGSLYGREQNGLGQFLVAFYTRRIKRLVPALVVCIVATSIMISMVNPYPQESLKTGIFAVFGLSNIFLYLQSVDYFAGAASLNPFTHTWSLGVEEQFYFIFPLMFWLGIYVLPRKISILVFTSLVLASFLAWWVISAEDSVLAFYIFLFRFWQLGIGALVFLVQSQIRRVGASSRVLKAIVVLGLLFLTFVPIAVEVRIGTSIAVVGTALMLFCTGPKSKVLAVLERPLPAYLGRISYSLYLWHWPITVLLKFTVGLTLATGAIGVLVSLCLAHLSYHFLERPLRKARWGRREWQELLAGSGAMITIAGLLAAQAIVLRPHILLVRPPAIEAFGTASLTLPYISQSGAEWAGGACVLSDDNQVGKVISPARCIAGQPLDTADTRVLVIGNSLSAAFVPAFDGLQFSGDSPTSFVVTSSWGASPVPAIANTSNWSKANDHYWTRIVPDLLAQLRPGDQVLLISDLSTPNAEFSPIVPTETSKVLIATMEANLRQLSDELASHDLELSILGPLPFSREALCPLEIAKPQWYSRGATVCRFYSRKETLARLAPINEMLERLEGSGRLTVVNLFPIFCPGEICSYFTPNGAYLYRDTAHASIEAARLSRPIWRDWLAKTKR